MKNWKTLNRKSTKQALERAVDSIADLITIIERRGEDDKIDTSQIENLIHKLRRIVDKGGE